MPNLHDSMAAKALQRVRKDCGHTLADAAEEISKEARRSGQRPISASQLSRIESGQASLSQERLEQIADAYGLSAMDLLAGDIVKAPSRVEIERLKSVVTLIQQVVLELRVKPSPEKLAEAVVMIYDRETEFILRQSEIDVRFDPERHWKDVESFFRR